MKQKYSKEHVLFIGQECSYDDLLLLKIWTFQLIDLIRTIITDHFSAVMAQKGDVLNTYQSFLSRIRADSLHSHGSVDLRVKL